jgi:hypothetical protein
MLTIVETETFERLLPYYWTEQVRIKHEIEKTID